MSHTTSFRTGGTPISRRDILIFLFKRKRTILPVFLGTVLLVTLFVYVVPPVYHASSKVLVERTKAPIMRTEPQPGLEMAEVINTEIAIVLSRTVVQRAVDRLKLDRLPKRDTWLTRNVTGARKRLEAWGLLDGMDEREKWIASLQKYLKVKPVLDSNVFTIRYGHEDPRLAAEIVNAITTEYLTHHSDIYSMQTAAGFYDANVERAKSRLKDLENKLKQYKESASLAAVAGKKEALVKELSTLRERINGWKLEIADAMTKYEATHPKVLVLEKKIAETERQITQVKWQLGNLEGDESHAEGLQTEIRLQEETLRSYKAQSDQAMLSAYGKTVMTNVHVIDRAEIPARPPFPRLFYIAISFLAGAILAVSAAMIVDYYDHRACTPEIVERAIGVPVLGSIGKLRMPCI